jgi:hypothetical protein
MRRKGKGNWNATFGGRMRRRRKSKKVGETAGYIF